MPARRPQSRSSRPSSPSRPRRPPAGRRPVCRCLANEPFFLGQRLKCRGIGNRPPQEFGHALFADLLQPRGDTCLAEVLLRQHVRGHLAPAIGHFHGIVAEHNRAVRVANLGRRPGKRHIGIGVLARFGESPVDLHRLPQTMWRVFRALLPCRVRFPGARFFVPGLRRAMAGQHCPGRRSQTAPAIRGTRRPGPSPLGVPSPFPPSPLNLVAIRSANTSWRMRHTWVNRKFT